MTSLAQFLISIVGPLAIKILLTLGIGTLTFTGVSESLQGVISSVQSNYNNMPAAVVGLAGLAGVPEGIGLILGAMATRVSVWVASKATQWVTKA